jgi:hypothetical protein
MGVFGAQGRVWKARRCCIKTKVVGRFDKSMAPWLVICGLFSQRPDSILHAMRENGGKHSP